MGRNGEGKALVDCDIARDFDKGCYVLKFNMTEKLLEDLLSFKYSNVATVTSQHGLADKIKGKSFDFSMVDDLPHFEWKEPKMKRFMVTNGHGNEVYFYTRAEAVAFMVDKNGVILYVAEHMNTLVLPKAKNVTVKVK